MSMRSSFSRCRPAAVGLLAAALLAAAWPAAANEGAPSPVAPRGTPQPTVSAVGSDAAPAIDLGQALHEVVAATQVRLRELSVAAKAAGDATRAAELHAQATAEIDALRHRLLEVQLTYAQKKGDTALEAELAGLLARLDQPAVAVPQGRPAPLPGSAVTSQPATAPAAR